nr:MAG TPA: hypothetical protein [Caudoviricetes sp.]
MNKGIPTFYILDLLDLGSIHDQSRFCRFE